MARVNASGTLDGGFNPNVSGNVYCVAVQADGKVLLGGTFATVGGLPRNNIARVETNGSVDPAFNPGANAVVRSITLQTDGGIIIGGEFTTAGGTARNRVARILADGTLDAGFNPNANNTVYGVTVMPDGKAALAGEFSSVGGVARNYLARLENQPATQSLTVPDSTRVRWLRGGTSPETQTVTFELTTNGGNLWTPAGAGSRVAGGWELTGLNLPPAGHIRARARTTGGYNSGSTGLTETVAAFSLLTPLQMWRQTYFGTPENTGHGGDNADPDKDGMENLIEFAFALNPNQSDAVVLPAWQLSDDDYSLTFTRPANVSGITYAAEYSATLAPGSWIAVPNAGTPPNYLFFVPAVAPRLYLRVRVTAP